MQRVSIVVPAFEEAPSLPELHRRLAAVADAEPTYDFEFVIVDDGSHDDTVSVLRRLRDADPRVRYVSLSRNFGHQAALSAGLDRAQGDAVVFLDADLQHPPEVVRDLLRSWESGAHVVNTVRRGLGDASMMKRAARGAFYRVVNLLADVRIQPGSADFRLLDRKAADALRAIHERARFVRGLVHWIGFRQATVAYDEDARFAGRPKYSLRKSLRLALDGIFSFSTVPLHVATAAGLVVSLGALVYAGYAVYMKVVAREAVQGWSSLLITTLFLGGVELTTLGILGTYVARIYDEVRRRPLYLVSDEAGAEPAQRSSSTGTQP
jgi:dolichol-phosphate mannosyltransferase